MLRRGTLIASLILLACVSTAKAEDAPATEAGAPGWTEFQAPDRGFSVSFPGSPKTSGTAFTALTVSE